MLRLVRFAIVSALCAAPLGAPGLPRTSAPVSHAAAVPVSDAGPRRHRHATPRPDDHAPITPDRVHNPVLWHDPGDIARKDLVHGLGGTKGEPRPPFTFLDEDTNGSNPKFDVRDANGVKWRVKLGAEARPEVAASRLLWAIGYYTDIDYLEREAVVPHLKLSRGSGHDRRGDLVLNARFARKPDDEKRIAAWAWKHNPFRGTREFNGLRVMMAVLNSWDLKDVNNAVYIDKDTGAQVFLVSDIGATFGTNSLRLKNSNGKGNAKKYIHSKFITHTSATEVSFATPAPPTTVVLETGGILFPMYIRRVRYDWIGDHIPRADARCIGDLLGRLTHRQLVDAFRAANFSPKDTEEFVAELEQRIAELKAL